MNDEFRGSAEIPRLGIIHVALNPLTGPWSVMRDLAIAQSKTAGQVVVALGVIHDRSWPENYRDEAAEMVIPVFLDHTPKLFGTGSFLFQRVRRPAIEKWIKDLAVEYSLKRVVVHFHNAWMSGVFLPLPRFDGIEIRAVVTIHGVNAFLRDKPVRLVLHRWMARRLLTYGAKLTSVDRSNLVRAESELHLPASGFVVVPNGVEGTDLRVRRVGAGGDSSIVFAHIGSISTQKGWRVAAEAIVLAHASGASCKLVIAGTGPEESDARQYAEDHPDCIEFLGYVSKPRENLMPSVDLLVLLSDHEGLPMSIIEAMSVGLPVIATDVGGVSEAVEDGKTGFLIPKSAEVLAERINGICSHPQLLSQLSTRALEVFESRFEISNIVEAYDEVYT
ncbi:MAG: glycosyltransferase family 4 protein [Verrucomicrobiales bacterium]